MTSATAAEIKSCCAGAYASPAARYLLGDSFHPGGTELTSELGRSLRLGPDALAADIGSGPGTSALQLARETGCRIVGVEIAAASVAEAKQKAHAAGLAARVEFLQGDAEALPLPDASIDGVLSECALCMFPEKRSAAREFARVLRPGGRFALSDMTAAQERLSAGLRSLSGWVACIGGAERLETLVQLLSDSGLAVEHAEQRDRLLAELLERIEARLRAARMLALPGLDGQIERGLQLAGTARAALARGDLGYAVVLGYRP
ncbi:MAG: class I SAM-dependent methyltransferase [Gaiellaceae bacterium]